MRLRQRQRGPVVLDRSREHAHEHGPVVVDPHDNCDRRVSLFVPDDDVPARYELDLRAGVPSVAVREAVAVASVVVEPQIPRRHVESKPSRGLGASVGRDPPCRWGVALFPRRALAEVDPATYRMVGAPGFARLGRADPLVDFLGLLLAAARAARLSPRGGRARYASRASRARSDIDTPAAAARAVAASRSSADTRIVSCGLFPRADGDSAGRPRPRVGHWSRGSGSPNSMSSRSIISASAAARSSVNVVWDLFFIVFSDRAGAGRLLL